MLTLHGTPGREVPPTQRERFRSAGSDPETFEDPPCPFE
jgi:hypothetical protein